MPKDVLAKLIGSTQIKNQGRKSLQTLQISADEQNIAGKSMVLPDDEVVPSKKKQLKSVEKVITVEKENATNLRRSKRKTAVSDLLNYAESPDDPKTSKSTSVKTKLKKNIAKPKKVRPPTQKKNKPEVDLNQTKLNFSSVTTVLRKISDIPGSASPEKSILGALSSVETEVNEDSGFDPSIGVSDQSLTLSTGVSKSYAVKDSCIAPDNKETSILTSVSPPLSYWKDLAEQRRLALEEALRENELIHDQLIVLEAENSQLKQLVKEAENLAQVVRGIIE